MNSKRSTEILVGLFVAAGMAALFVLAMKVSNLGDITDEKIFTKVNGEIHKNDCKFLLATPPCQGMSSLGKKNIQQIKEII